MSAWPLVVLLVVVLLAASQLPRLARRLGEAQKDIKHGGWPADPDDA